MSTNASGESRYNVRIPSLFEIFFGRLANWFRQLKEWRKQGLLRKALKALQRRRAMRLETLEPRVLLSADPVAALDLGHIDDGLAIDHTSVLDTNDAGPDDVLPEADATSDEVPELDLSGPAAEEASPIAASADIAATVASSGEVIFGIQTVHLDFDGAAGVDYNGPITLADLDRTAFTAPLGLEGYEADIIASTLGTLDGLFAEYGLVFTLDQPAGSDYSTL